MNKFMISVVFIAVSMVVLRVSGNELIVNKYYKPDNCEGKRLSKSGDLLSVHYVGRYTVNQSINYCGCEFVMISRCTPMLF